MTNRNVVLRMCIHFILIAPLAGAILCLSSLARAQSTQAPQSDENNPVAQEFKKFPELLPAIGRLIQRFQGKLHLPETRGESHLLPLLPESTMYYAALSNYGDFAHQVVTVFRQQLEDDPQLRNWWEHGSLAEAGPKALDALDKVAQFEGFLGDETVFSGSVVGQKPNLLFLAEARKPGLKKFLEQLAAEFGTASHPPFHVLEPQELATPSFKETDSALLFLIRPDYILAASDLASLRSANSLLDRRLHSFAATPFGRRLAREYQGGATLVAGADLQKLLTQLPSNVLQNSSFQRSGFADVQYLVWRRGSSDGEPASRSELSFTGPRHGIAAWLGKPGPLNSLDFVPPRSFVALAALLISPAQIFDQVRTLNAPPNSEPTSLVPMEQALGISLRDDLLNLLTGEFAIGVDSIDPNVPAGRFIFGVRDAAHLQRTLSTLLSAAHLQAEDFEDGTLTYHVIHAPVTKVPVEVTYTFADSYLVIGTNREITSDSIHLHTSGQSLARSAKLAFPSTGQVPEASAFLFQDPMVMAALQARRFMPGLASSIASLAGSSPATVVSVYANDTSIRQTSNNGAFDVGAVLVVAAIAIPNLIKSKIAANEASAAGSIRTVNTAQVTYSSIFPNKGYAPNLASLGTNPKNPSDASSPDYPALIAPPLATDACVGDTWCVKSGYKFKITARCKRGMCDDYVAVATPVSTETGSRSFCSTADGIIHFKLGPPLIAPLTISQCRTWPPLQ